MKFALVLLALISVALAAPYADDHVKGVKGYNRNTYMKYFIEQKTTSTEEPTTPKEKEVGVKDHALNTKDESISREKEENNKDEDPNEVPIGDRDTKAAAAEEKSTEPSTTTEDSYRKIKTVSDNMETEISVELKPPQQTDVTTWHEIHQGENVKGVKGYRRTQHH